MATQKETSSAGPDSRSKIVLLVDASQQTGKEWFVCLFICLFILAHVGRCMCADSKLMLSVSISRLSSLHPLAESGPGCLG